MANDIKMTEFETRAKALALAPTHDGIDALAFDVLAYWEKEGLEFADQGLEWWFDMAIDQIDSNEPRIASNAMNVIASMMTYWKD